MEGLQGCCCIAVMFHLRNLFHSSGKRVETSEMTFPRPHKVNQNQSQEQNAMVLNPFW